jgi:hypothetical protein
VNGGALPIAPVTNSAYADIQGVTSLFGTPYVRAAMGNLSIGLALYPAVCWKELMSGGPAVRRVIAGTEGADRRSSSERWQRVGA